jgi:hypothetical protein
MPHVCPSPECKELRVFVETPKGGLTLNRRSYAAGAANLFIFHEAVRPLRAYDRI